jgi:hypothetical protein
MPTWRRIATLPTSAKNSGCGSLACRERRCSKRPIDSRLCCRRCLRHSRRLAHAFHLAKRDDRINGVGVGPGGDQVNSLGHHLVATQGLPVFSVWLLYGGGGDSQPFPDLPRTASYPADSLNAHLAGRRNALIVPMRPGTEALERDVGIGHMYNLVVPVHLPSQADAIFFVPQVTPLQP